MAQVKLTKNELRDQEHKLAQLKKYLPTLQLKKAMLQTEVFNARVEIDARMKDLNQARDAVARFSPMLKETLSIDLSQLSGVVNVEKHYENIAGVEIPYFDDVTYPPADYPLFDTPDWVDGSLVKMREVSRQQVQVDVAREKCAALEKELREVSIRVNLFEKVLIPRAQGNIKKIKVFLGDQQLSAVGMAKVAKAKIERRKH